MTNRKEIFDALEDERKYQDDKWGPDDPGKNAANYLLYMQHHLNRAMEVISSKHDPEATREALDQVRKVTALGVACMENNGLVTRQ